MKVDGKQCRGRGTAWVREAGRDARRKEGQERKQRIRRRKVGKKVEKKRRRDKEKRGERTQYEEGE